MDLSMVQQRSRVLASGLSFCLLVGAGCSANNSNNAGPSGISCATNPSLPGFSVPQGPPAVTGGFAYAVRTSSSKVVWYKVESSGVLTSSGEICAGLQPTFIAANSARKLAYVTNFSSDTVSAYRIGADGGLTLLGSPVPAGNGPGSISVDWTGNLVYVTNFESDSVSVYEIESNGTLTRVQDLQTGLGPDTIVVDPTGKFVYVAHFKSDTLTAHRVNATTRRLETTPIATYHTGLAGPNAITIHPTASFIYVTNEDNNTVSAFRMETTGALTLIGSPFSVSTGLGPEGVAVDPSGSFAYVTDGQADTISIYPIDANGGLQTPLSPVPAGNDPEGIVVDPTKGTAYVIHRDSRDIFTYKIGDPIPGALKFLSRVPL